MERYSEQELLEAREMRWLRKVLTKGDESKDHRMITGFFLTTMVVMSIFGFSLTIFSTTWADINMTVFPVLDGILMGSIVVFFCISIFQPMITFIELNMGKAFITKRSDIRGLRIVKKQFAIASITLLLLIVILSSYSAYYGFTNFRSKQFIYVEPHSDLEIFSGSFDGESLEFEGIISFIEDVEIVNSTISFVDEGEVYGIIVEKNCSLRMENVSFNGGDPDRIIFEVAGTIRAYNCEFTNLEAGFDLERDSGLKIYNDGFDNESIFEGCSFNGSKGHSLLIQWREVVIRDCSFTDTGLGSIRSQGGDLRIENSRFVDVKRAVTLIRSDFVIDGCSIEDSKMGIYAEDSVGRIVDTDFKDISSYAIQYYHDEPDLVDCTFNNCDVTVKEIDYLGYQFFCFLITPLGLIISSLVFIAGILITNRIIEKRLKEKWKNLPEKEDPPKKWADDSRMGFRKSRYSRLVLILIGSIVVGGALIFSIPLRFLLDATGPMLCQLSLGMGAMILVVVILPGLLIMTKKKGHKYFPSSYYPLEDGFIIRFAEGRNHKITWEEGRDIVYNDTLNILTMFLDRKFDITGLKKDSKRGDGFSLTIHQRDRERIKKKVRELNYSKGRKS